MDKYLKDEYYRFMIENSLDAVLLSSPDGEIYRVNPAACELFQRTEEEICQIGRPGVVDPDDPRLGSALSRREADGSVRTEVNIVRKDGSVVPTDSTSAFFTDAAGRIWAVNAVRDITAYKEREKALICSRDEAERFAAYDYLTNILNRRTFLVKLQQEIYRAKREKKPLGLLMLDIDFFKKINDEMGHNAGDAVLRHFSRSLSEKIRPYDILARYGGDEFIICLPNTRFEEALKVADRLRSHIETSNVYYDVKQLKLTSSIGVGCCEYDSGEDPSELIYKVDQCLLTAKKRRNFVYGQQNAEPAPAYMS
jgi:diguanylate cyclase (GGDEF)-like protein/PAS domain S-box-containing protein